MAGTRRFLLGIDNAYARWQRSAWHNGGIATDTPSRELWPHRSGRHNVGRALFLHEIDGVMAAEFSLQHSRLPPTAAGRNARPGTVSSMDRYS
jgi:hypothetical protein